MSAIKINDGIWNAISADEQTALQKHLREHGVLQQEDTIVPDANTPPPAPDAVLYGATVAEAAGMGVFRSWLCLAACDAAAAAAVAACTATGPALAACLALIEASRRACRDRC